MNRMPHSSFITSSWHSHHSHTAEQIERKIPIWSFIASNSFETDSSSSFYLHFFLLKFIMMVIFLPHNRNLSILFCRVFFVCFFLFTRHRFVLDWIGQTNKLLIIMFMTVVTSFNIKSIIFVFVLFLSILHMRERARAYIIFVIDYWLVQQSNWKRRPHRYSIYIYLPVIIWSKRFV